VYKKTQRNTRFSLRRKAQQQRLSIYCARRLRSWIADD
jgi:hypothetical protein